MRPTYFLDLARSADLRFLINAACDTFPLNGVDAWVRMEEDLSAPAIRARVKLDGQDFVVSVGANSHTWARAILATAIAARNKRSRH